MLLPRWRSYAIRRRVATWPDGAVGHELVRVPLAELADWDEAHDPAGRSLRSESTGSAGSALTVDPEKA